MKTKPQFGLKPLPHDPRDFALGAVYDLPKLSELPETFLLEDPFPPDHQEGSSACSGSATASVSSLQEGKKLSGKSAYGFSKSITKDFDSWGQDLRSAARAHVEIGCLDESDEPADLTWENAHLMAFRPDFEELKNKAAKNKKASYWKVVGSYDAFDDIRAAIYCFRNEKKMPFFGVLWQWALSQYLIETGADEGTGHAMCSTRGWEERDWLIVKQSYGESAGKDGYHKIHRNVINKFAEMYGAYIFTDMPREEAEVYFKKKVWYEDIAARVALLVKKLLELIKKVIWS